MPVVRSKSGQTRHPVNAQPSEGGIFRRFCIDQAEGIGGYDVPFGFFVDEYVDSCILKVGYSTHLSKDVKLYQRAPIYVHRLLAFFEDKIGVKPKLEAFEHDDVLFGQIKRLLFGFYEIAIKGGFEVWSRVEEKLLVNLEQGLCMSHSHLD